MCGVWDKHREVQPQLTQLHAYTHQFAHAHRLAFVPQQHKHWDWGELCWHQQSLSFFRIIFKELYIIYRKKDDFPCYFLISPHRADSSNYVYNVQHSNSSNDAGGRILLDQLTSTVNSPPPHPIASLTHCKANNCACCLHILHYDSSAKYESNRVCAISTKDITLYGLFIARYMMPWNGQLLSVELTVLQAGTYKVCVLLDIRDVWNV